MRSFVVHRWQDIHSANASRSSVLSECSHHGFDWCSFHTVYVVKFRTLLGSLVLGVCSLSHSFRSSSDDGDHDRYTKLLQSVCAVRCKAQAGEIVLAFVSVSSVFFLWVECPSQRNRIGFCWASLVNWTKRRNHMGKDAFCFHSLGRNLKFRRATWLCVM